jgi:alpha-tubulin suppressor-like RCC1 family protein
LLAGLILFLRLCAEFASCDLRKVFINVVSISFSASPIKDAIDTGFYVYKIFYYQKALGLDLQSVLYLSFGIAPSTEPAKVKAISGGFGHICALLSNGKVKCWGINNVGQIGDGSEKSIRIIPVTVVGLSNATAISSGSAHTCALLSNGSVKCWGYDNYGQLGDGEIHRFILPGLIEEKYFGVPITVVGLSNAIAIAAGDEHTCALLSNGSIKCWGRNDWGELGNGKSSPEENYSSTPVLVNGIKDAIGICAGSIHTCALLKNRTVKCWGSNFMGQLGYGKITAQSWNVIPSLNVTPTTIRDLSNVAKISCGDTYTCALLTNGSVKCWGGNWYAFTRYGKTSLEEGYNFTPVNLVGISNAIAISAGSGHACAVLSNGSVKCWGSDNYGQLGDITNPKIFPRFSSYKPLPVTVVGLSDAVNVTTTYFNSCALLKDGKVKCWGVNFQTRKVDAYSSIANWEAGTYSDITTIITPPVSVVGLN